MGFNSAFKGLISLNCEEVIGIKIANIKFFICPTNAHNSYKIVKLLKSFKIIIVAPTCFGLHKPSSGSSQPVLRQVTMLISVTYIVN